MPNPKTPGVSIEEMTKLPHFVTLVESAVPVFIGYTDQIPVDYEKPLKIGSLLEYEKHFGKEKQESIQLKDVEGKGVTVVAPEVQFLMYYSLQMYFANGGGSCYIVPVGKYTSVGVELPLLESGLNEIGEEIKEPLLIVFPDAISLSEPDFYSLYNHTIEKIELEKKNWFAILDTYQGHLDSLSDDLTTIAHFRAAVNSTSHAATYFPHVKTILNYSFDENETAISHTGLQSEGQDSAVFYAGEIAAIDELKIMASDEISGGSANGFVLADLLGQAIAIAEEVNLTADVKEALTEAIDEAKIVLNAIYDGTIDDFIVPEDLNENDPVFSGEFDALKAAILNAKDLLGEANGFMLKDLEMSNSLLYNQIKEAMKSLKVILPPSSVMAGVYGRIDSTRGVWKAPANVSLQYVIHPTEKISDQEQADLNIHDSGKSINAIRIFAGKGNLVWGARTLDGKDKKQDGNDNEWKYVHVRRYYDMIEQSVREALGKFINEPNTPYTWLRAETMIENFLNQQWIDGALAGSVPQEAYSVEIGSDKTETMKVTIKMALVRPAEFIILNFSHKLQQS